MSKSIKSIDIKNRFLELLNSKVLESCDELEIFQVISTKYEFKTITNYAKDKNLTYAGVVDKIKRNKQPFIIIDNVTFCF